MTYLIKRLQQQELGSIRNDTSPKRGRYFYITKQQSFLSEFPLLSTSILNDFRILSLVPLYKENIEIDYCNFVYHNDQYHNSGTRNEYRLYINKALEENQLLFQPNDIIVLIPRNIDGIEDTLYFLYLANDTNNDTYIQLQNELTLNSATRGSNYAVSNIRLSEIEDAISRSANILTTFGAQSASSSVNIESTRNISDYISQSENIQVNFEDLFTSQAMFRNFVSFAYNYHCAITNDVITCGTFNNLEAAHIMPRSQGGPFTPNNGILLNRDLHWAFDIGAFTIRNDMTIRVHEEVRNEWLQSLNNVMINTPVNSFFYPSREFLEYHAENIFGMFIR